MSIASEIKRIKTNIANAYKALSNKGVTLPATQNSANLQATVESLPTGGGATNIAGLPTDLWYVDEEGKLYRNENYDAGKDLVITATDIVGSFSCAYTFYQGKGISSISFPNLSTISGSYALYFMCASHSDISSVSFPKLTSISGNYAFNNAFFRCVKLSSVSFPKLTSISGRSVFIDAFRDCTNLTSVSFPELTTLSGDYVLQGIFNDCSNIVSMSFPKLTSISGQSVFIDAFRNCTNLTSLSFPELTNIENKSLVYCLLNSSITELHFRKDMQSTVEALTDYNKKFGKSDVTIYFDLGSTDEDFVGDLAVGDKAEMLTSDANTKTMNLEAGTYKVKLYA